MKKIITLIFSGVILTMMSCKKDYLETIPSNGVTEQELFKQLNTVLAALNGTVKGQFAFNTGSTANRHDAFGQRSYDLASDLMGNDMTVHAQGYGWFNTDYNLTEWISPVANRQSDLAWYFYYNINGQVNTILKNLEGVSGATEAQKDQIKGEALALRAYVYYHLINLFQQTYKGNETKPGVPVYTVPSIIGNPRGTVQDVYDRIIADLTEAETLLTGKPRVSKAHMDVTTVQGFRARVALLQEDWPKAATYAVKARTGYTLMDAATYPTRSAFSNLTANPEGMWGSIIPAAEATTLASFYSHIDASTGGYANLGPQQKKITKALYDQIPAGDVRKTVFRTPGTGAGSLVDYVQLKLRTPIATSWEGDYIYMRASEMYLIEAEALARQGQEGPARTALETMVKARYPAYSAAGFSGQALIDEILLQRRIELWGEGFSLIDIKRLNQGLNRPTGTGNHGSPNLDPGVYTTSAADPRFIMRIPARELDNNFSMTPNDQNP